MPGAKLVFALLGALSASLVPSVHAHAVIQAVTGANGVVTTGFGVLSSTPRTGTDEQNFQVDTSVLKNLVDDPCGATLSGGSVNIATNLAAMEAANSGVLPSLNADGSITMSIHQVNADGGGPFFAMVNADATGLTWEPAEVTLQPPGVNGLLIAGPNDADLTAVVPSNVTCTGGTAGNACLIRLSNGGPGSVANGAGPFGGCLAVQQGTGSTAASTAAASTATTATTTKTKGNKKNKANNRREAEKSVEIIRRNERLAALAKRLSLTFSDIEDLKTATGTAIDVRFLFSLVAHDFNCGPQDPD
ncbi:hypothetical protein BDZ89DRAFT_938143 [Hymenopellis radicata]|nr:hypothetical protein BDZ89DRAFT_938143 [Hymenopellis radicata]